MQSWAIGVLASGALLLIGVGIAGLALRLRANRRRLSGRNAYVCPEPRRPEHPERADSASEEAIDEPLVESPEPAHLAGLVAETLRKPLARLRRLRDCPPEVREPLERLATRLRLLDTRPRPMQAQPISPYMLLQDASEDVEPLRTGAVGISWSLRTRDPVLVDRERTGLALRELLEACAQSAGPGGKVGIRVLGNPDPIYPVRIEVEVGRRFAEVDALALLVVQHLLETQGARVQVDSRVTRITFRGPEKEADGDQIPSNR